MVKQFNQIELYNNNNNKKQLKLQFTLYCISI